jgi:LPS export ABC transporter protein LptC
MTKQALMINTSLLLAALWSTWLCLKPPLLERYSKRPADNTMDSFMSKASYMQTNEQGSAQTQVSAERIEYYSGENSAIFYQPDITVYPESWHITADSGITKQGAEKIYLKNNVKAEQYQVAHSGSILMTLLTSALDISPAKKIIETKQPITLLQAGTVVKSTGLRVNIQRGTIEFLSKASAHFDAFHAPWVKKMPKIEKTNQFK